MITLNRPDLGERKAKIGYLSRSGHEAHSLWDVVSTACAQETIHRLHQETKTMIAVKTVAVIGVKVVKTVNVKVDSASGLTPGIIT